MNEPNYLGKAIHYWNPAWAPNDFFLESGDAHWTFYVTFGWLSLWIAEAPLTWIGRVLTWGLLAWAWQRLSFAVVPRRWVAVLSAALFVFLMQHGNMAGEWVIGGMEAKGFAYVLVLLGLSALVAGRWNRVWLLLGAAGAFHAIVGGWAAVAAGMVWAYEKAVAGATGAATTRAMQGATGLPVRAPAGSSSSAAPSPPGHHAQHGRLPRGERGEGAPSLRKMWPGLVGGLLLALPGVVPALAVNWGVDRAVVRQADQIYVYQRLYHHLDPWRFPIDFVITFAILCEVWWLLARSIARADAANTPPEPGDVWQTTPHSGPLPQGEREREARRRLRSFVWASLIIALAGWAASLIKFYDLGLAAGILKYYWFRLSDVAVPLGLAILGSRWLLRKAKNGSAAGRWWFRAAIVLAAWHATDCVVMRLFAPPPYADRLPNLAAWQ
ncbi:MAG: hypothetical protein ABSG68_04455, partial [Thermoguttaceae bacterium]